MIPQAERQLNLLRQSNANPKISAYAYVYGPHDYNRHPFVPIGMEAMVYKKPKKRNTFARHCVKGWVLGTLMEHYRNWIAWCTETKATRTLGAMFMKHKCLTNPAATPEDAIVAAAGNLSKVLLHKVLSNQLKETSLAAL